MDHLEAGDSIDNVHKQLKFLSKNNNIVEELRRTLTCWDYRSTDSITDFIEDIEQVVGEIQDVTFPNNNDVKTNKLVWSFVHFEIYDHISSRIKEKFAKDDLNLYEISKEFCKNNGSPKQLGATFYNFIPNAAVVELSMLNNKRTPVEKLECLRSAYDYIFAEVKGALISIISKYSEKEIDLPSINNKEVIPIVMAVILKSKLFYFSSEMYYIAQFGTNILNNDTNLREIYQVFEESLNKIWTKSESPQKPYEKLDDKLNVCDTIKFIEKVAAERTNKQTVLEEEKKRVVKLITSATTESLIQ